MLQSKARGVFSIGFGSVILLALALMGGTHDRFNSLTAKKLGIASRSEGGASDALDKLVRGDVIPGRYIVELKSSVPVQQFLISYGFQFQNLSNSRGAANYSINYVYEAAWHGFAGTLSSSLARQLRGDSRVVRVYPDHVVTLDEEVQPTNIESTDVWGLSRIDQRQGPSDSEYHFKYSGKGVHVYILDTGLRRDHDDFGGRAQVGFAAGDIDTSPGDAGDCHGHGTHTSATVGGKKFGVAKSVSLVGIRSFGCRGKTSESALMSGLDWIGKNLQKPAVVNLSLGGKISQPFDDAVKKLIDAGAVVVASAGNSTADACQQSPAHLSEVITVGATNSEDQRAPFSNYGECVDIYAPGVDILSAGIKNVNDSAIKSGTSMSAPHVTGVVALLLEHYPAATPARIQELLLQYSTKDIVGDPQSSLNNFLYSLEQ